jgi:hypothetical protein
VKLGITEGCEIYQAKMQFLKTDSSIRQLYLPMFPLQQQLLQKRFSGLPL